MNEFLDAIVAASTRGGLGVRLRCAPIG